MMAVKFLLALENLARDGAHPEILLNQIIALHKPAIGELRDAPAVRKSG